jgi:VWFA-related protein
LELYKPLAQRRLASTKGEFETTESYVRRMHTEAAKPLFGSLKQESVFAFVIGQSDRGPGKLETEYDADRKVLHASARLSHAFDGSSEAGKSLNWAEFVQEHSFYTGANALGARVRVERYVQLLVRIAFSNYDQFPLADYSRDSAFAADLNLDMPAAINAKKNIRLLLVCRLVPPYAMGYTGYVEPTIDSPHEETQYYHSLNTELLEIWFFDSVTGQIYAKQKPQVIARADTSPTEAVSTEVPKVKEAAEARKSNSELVTLNVRVIDRNNRPIAGLRQDEFKVYEAGVLQPIVDFSHEEVPISYGLALDTSASLRSQLNSVIDTARTIINSNKQADETFLARFISGGKIETIQDFTSNKDLLRDGLDKLYIEGGQTAVIDGLYRAAELVGEYKKGNDDDRRRRALIVITNGEDRDSSHKEAQLFQLLREEDVQIYVIGFVNELDNDNGFIRTSPRSKAVALINQLATETGGQAFFPQSLAELSDIVNAIWRDMRTQYLINYSPTNKARDGTYRSIRVEVDESPNHDKRIALTRSGRRY